MKSYLYQDGENLVRVEYVNGQVVIEKYSKDFVLLSAYSMEISPDAEWGGFFAGKTYNFIMLGWENKFNDDAATVLRIIKYDKAWKYIGQADLYNADTTIPFDAGSLRCAEKDGTLFIHTSHEMYSGHQSNMTVAVRESDMLITTRNDSDLRQFYVSHSFNQFILVDQENNIVTLDHGDGYPRAVYLQRRKIYGNRTGGRSSAVVQNFPGNVGDNTTGASIGGLAETSSGYVTAYNYNGIGAPPSQEEGVEVIVSAEVGSRDIYLSYTPKSDFSSNSTVVTKLTDYNTGRNDPVYTPVLASIGLDGGYVLWREYDKSNHISYTTYSNDGSVSEIKTVIGSLSDCQPIEYQGKIVWYVTDNSAPIFYVLDENGLTSYSSKSFTDVPIDAYYTKAVIWAIENNITSGTSNTTFSPDATCTQAQIITFLYRAVGEPTVVGESSHINDMVTSDQYYYNAMLWAYQNGIIEDSGLNPNSSCSRSDVVTYLWRLADSPTIGSIDFTDVSASASYGQAVAWAVKQGITYGTSATTFSPDEICSRGQIVTFLYRVYATE